jgi:hypothetical protein
VDVLSQQLVEWENGFAAPGGAVEFFAQNFPPSVTYTPYNPAVMALDQSAAIEGAILQEAYLILMNATSNQVGGQTANQELYAASKIPAPRVSLLQSLHYSQIGLLAQSSKTLTLAQLVETQRGRSFSWGTLLIQLLLF